MTRTGPRENARRAQPVFRLIFIQGYCRIPPRVCQLRGGGSGAKTASFTARKNMVF